MIVLLFSSLVLVAPEYMLRSLFAAWMYSERVDTRQLMQDEDKDSSHHSIHNDPIWNKLVLLHLLFLSSAAAGEGDELDDDKDKDFVDVQRCNDIYFEESNDNL